MAQLSMARSNSKTNLSGLSGGAHAAPAPFRLPCVSSGMRRVSSEPSMAPMVCSMVTPPLRTSACGVTSSTSGAHVVFLGQPTHPRPVSRLASLSSSFQGGIGARLGAPARNCEKDREGANPLLSTSGRHLAPSNSTLPGTHLHADKPSSAISAAHSNHYSDAAASSSVTEYVAPATAHHRHTHVQQQQQQAAQSELISAAATGKQQQQQQHAAGPTMARAGGFSSGAPFASLSRVLLVGQPSMFRSIVNRKIPATFGPLSLLLFLFGAVMAIVAAVRASLVKRAKSCRCCRGFGLVRCRLCDGRGTVDWRAKFSYSEPCPLCLAKRFVACPDCGGHYHRPLFTHSRVAAPAAGPAAAGTVSYYASSTSHPLD